MGIDVGGDDDGGCVGIDGGCDDDGECVGIDGGAKMMVIVWVSMMVLR